MTRGMAYFPRMLDKIRLHARGELGTDYHENLGSATALDGVCCNFLRVNMKSCASACSKVGAMRRSGVVLRKRSPAQ
jgi:hypothetical protein